MRVRVRELGGGLHPNQTVVQVETTSGLENLVVDKRDISGESLSVGAPLRQDKDLMLIELPRESMSGAWRVWVKRDLLTPEKVAA